MSGWSLHVNPGSWPHHTSIKQFIELGGTVMNLILQMKMLRLRDMM